MHRLFAKKSMAPLCMVFMLLVSVNAGALVGIERSFAELVSNSELIVVGEVTNMRAQRVRSNIYTFMDLQILETLKGATTQSTYTVRMLGGSIPPFIQKIAGAPEFKPNLKYILFIKGNNQDIFPFVGVKQGIFQIVKDSDGIEYVFNIEEMHFLKQSIPLATIRSITQQKESGLPLDGFLNRVRSELGKNGG